MTTGMILRRNLGLENFKYIKINRAVVSSYKVLFIWFDSYRKTMPITNYRIKNFPWVANIFHGTFIFHNTKKQTTFTPPMDLVDYNGAVRGSLVIPVNMAGDRFIDKKEFTKVFENVQNEKFLDYVKVSSYDATGKYAIHVNPTLSEIKEIKEETGDPDLRGIYIASTEKMYVSSSKLTHDHIIKSIPGLKRGMLIEYGVRFSTDEEYNNIVIEYSNSEALASFLNNDFYNTYLLHLEPELIDTFLEQAPLMQFNRNLLEFVTLYDLADKGNMSAFTGVWRKDRNRTMGGENTTAKLVDCFLSEADNSVVFSFRTEATSLKGKDVDDNIASDYKFYDGDKGQTDKKTFDIKKNISKSYELQIKILEFFDWLDVFEGEKVTPKNMKDILETSNVQVFSTSPSFHWQGMNFNLSQMDGSAYPTDISNPIWGPRHGDKSGYFLDKHLNGLLRQIKFFMNPMASMLSSKIKAKGLFDN